MRIMQKNNLMDTLELIQKDGDFSFSSEDSRTNRNNLNFSLGRAAAMAKSKKN
jgi:hypothetical protein